MGELTPELLDHKAAEWTAEGILAGLPHVPDADRAVNWFSSPREYPCYAALASILKPRSVLEIGVRFGYSLVAMLRGHIGIERIVGVDDESYERGSMAGARENILATGYAGSLDLRACTSHEFFRAALAMDPFDLVHVDGDHTEVGAWRDVLEGWALLRPEGGVMVVDDYDFIEEVGRAVSGAHRSIVPAREFRYDSLRGWWVGIK